jgi:selenide,water dikinase
MATLNKAAAEVLARFHPMACTDVTGFGLAGHAAEMVTGEHCGLRLHLDQVPLLPDVETYAAMGLIPEGTYRNREGRLRFLSGNTSASALDLLFDPQTSGGLLVALPDTEADAALAALRAVGVPACCIGETGGPAGLVEIR